MINHSGRYLKFGTGDIQIWLSAEKGTATLIFNNLDEPEPIGDMTMYPKGTANYTIRPGDVVMTFTNPESIDAMIKALQTVKHKAFDDQ